MRSPASDTVSASITLGLPYLHRVSRRRALTVLRVVGVARAIASEHTPGYRSRACWAYLRLIRAHEHNASRLDCSRVQEGNTARAVHVLNGEVEARQA